MNLQTGMVLTLGAACSSSRPMQPEAVKATPQALTTECSAPRLFGAVPDDGADDRASLQMATIACAGHTLTLEPGTYTLSVVSAYRDGVSLVLRSNLRGARGGQSVLKFDGDAGGHDWVGVLVPGGSTGTEVADIRFDGDSVSGVNEHSALLQVFGPTTGVEVHHNSCWYPALGDRGDCVSLIGYPATSKQPDRMNRAIRVHHNRIEAAGRVGIAFHSGTEGEIDHNVFLDGGRAPDLDGEGSGSNALHIHHNEVRSGPHTTSFLALNVEGDAGHKIHDNIFHDKGINLWGCANSELR